MEGVIIGPQQPGVVLTTMCPPSSTGRASRRRADQAVGEGVDEYGLMRLAH
jgi:hypothetical protein